MTKMTPATPLPWSRKDGHYHHVRTGDIEYFIHAANSYPKLVAALKALLPITWNDGPLVAAYRKEGDAAEALLREIGEE